MHFAGGQDLLAQHGNSNGSEMNGGIRLASPLNGQPASATLTITNDHLLPQSPANSGMAGQDCSLIMTLAQDAAKGPSVLSQRVSSSVFDSTLVKKNPLKL